MRALTFLGAGRVEWRDVPAPRLAGDGEVLVRPLAVAACDLDFAVVRGLAPFPPPFVLGHELVAEVVEIGDAVHRVRPGDRVVVPFQISCGTCASCRRGMTATCTSVHPVSTFGIGRAGGDWGGALADLLRVPYADHMLVPLPPDVPPVRAASAADNVAFGYFAVVRQLAARPGAAVLVLGGGGGGSIPLYATALALAHGAERVDLYDRDVRRLEIASRLGATSHEIDEWPEQLGSYPIVVEYTRVGGHPVASEFRQRAAGLACALRSTAPGGHCTSVSIFFGGQAPVPITEMYMKGITFQTGRVHSRTVLPDVLELIASRRIDPDLVTTETARWEDADEALLAYTTKLVLARE